MKKALESIFEKKSARRGNEEWIEYAQQVRGQFLSLKEKGISIPVFTV